MNSLILFSIRIIIHIFIIHILKIFFILLFLLPFLSQAKKNTYLNLPLLSSFGGAGRAAVSSAEYHLINAASIAAKGSKNKFSGYYSFTKTNYLIGGSISSREDIPVGISWIWTGDQHITVFSFAGKINKQWITGVSIHYFSKENIFYPHLGFLYQLNRKLRLGFTFDFMEYFYKKTTITPISDSFITYGLGVFFNIFDFLNMQADITYYNKQWTVAGGVELVTKNYFSLKLGTSFPQKHYSLGIGLIGYPIKLDYTWIKEQGHCIGIRINTS